MPTGISLHQSRVMSGGDLWQLCESAWLSWAAETNIPQDSAPGNKRLSHPRCTSTEGPRDSLLFHPHPRIRLTEPTPSGTLSHPVSAHVGGPEDLSLAAKVHTAHLSTINCPDQVTWPQTSHPDLHLTSNMGGTTWMLWFLKAELGS